MKELATKILEYMANGRDTVLATVIARQGSAPRGVGAQMLVDQYGLVLGTVGGGSVEEKSIKHGQELLKKQRSDQSFFSLELGDASSVNMVCGGSVEIAFSYIHHKDLAWKGKCEKVLSCFATFTPGFLEIETTAGIFPLSVPLPERVIIFGGGHVAKALVPLLAGVGFYCIVVENRPDFARKERFPLAGQVIAGDYENIDQTIDIRERDFLILMTHEHLHDYILQEQLLRKPHAYIGVMGSARKKAFVNEKLRKAGISDEAINRVHTPIGLNIGAATPEEIAVSVAAECIQVRAALR